MASAPEYPWVVVLLDGYKEPTKVAMRSANRQGCLEWILEQRLAGDEFAYTIYCADSTHLFVKENRIVWERPQ